MNKAILCGRITRDIELQGNENKYCKFGLAVERRFKREETDFINIVAFGKTAEFCDKYFVKGQKISLVGRIQTGSYDKDDGTKVYTTDVIAEEVYFAESKKDTENNNGSDDGFEPVDDDPESDLPF